VVNFIKSAWTAVSNTNKAIWNAIKAVIQAVWNVIGPTVMRAVNRVKSALTSAWNTAKSITTSAWNGIKNAIKSAIDGFMALVRGIRGRVTGALSGAANWLYNAGRNIIRGLIRGIESMLRAVTGTINKITGRIAAALPGSPVDEGPLRVLNRGYAGKEIVKMIVAGIEREEPSLNKLIRSLGTINPNTVAASASPVVAGAAINNATGKAAAWGANGINVEKLEVQAYTDRFSLKQVQEELALHGAV